MKFSIKNLCSKCDQIRRKLLIWSHLLKKSLMENLIFCTMKGIANSKKNTIQKYSKIKAEFYCKNFNIVFYICSVFQYQTRQLFHQKKKLIRNSSPSRNFHTVSLHRNNFSKVPKKTHHLRGVQI